MSNLEKSAKNFARNYVRPLIPQSVYARLVYVWHALVDRGNADAQQWPAMLGDPRLDPILKDMLVAANELHGEAGASNYWAALNLKNTRQYIEHGFENFKQTVALDYFTFVGKNNYQLGFLRKALAAERYERASARARSAPRHRIFSEEESLQYNLMTYLIWEYLAQEAAAHPLVTALEEPAIGNPLAVPLDGRSVTQDLGNSLLDLISLEDALRNVPPGGTILELGAGYGRTSFVLQNARPDIRYVIVDIPPALYSSQTYLSRCFPEKQIFRFRKFDSFVQVEDELRSSQLDFLMPAQLKLLPRKFVDLFIAIDCLHEMRRDQIRGYFAEMDRIARSAYFSCRKVATVPYEKIILSEKDYAGLPSWEKVYWRERKIHSDYFEAYFRI